LKVLISGAAGFIGSHVCRRCINLGMDVVALDDLSGGFIENIPQKAKFIKLSILDYEQLKLLFKEEKFDYVYHLAAYAAEGLSHFIRRFNYNNNLIGSINLINLSVLYHIKCFVFTSSIAVYGFAQVPMIEEIIPIPTDPYGISKYGVELDIKTASEMFGLNYIIFRPHNVYGENQNVSDKYRNVIGIFMNQILKGESLTVFGDGKQKRAFSYIDDVAPIIAESTLNKSAYGEVFNIGGETPYTINELIDAISDSMNITPKINYLPERKETKIAYSDHSKIKKYFNITETTPLKIGVDKMAKWAYEFRCKPTKNFDNIEIPYNLPKNWEIKEESNFENN
jgi:UDP-glucose 4-epimerase